MTTLTDTPEIVGRGNREGADLFRDWFTDLNETAKSGNTAAYVFVMGSINEILKTFDFPVTFPEINSSRQPYAGLHMNILRKLRTTATPRYLWLCESRCRNAATRWRASNGTDPCRV